MAIGSTGREIRASQNGLTPGNDKIREGQRFTDQTIDLFFVRPHWQRSEETVDCPIAQIRYVRSCKLWQLYWIRNDGKWLRYVPRPVAPTLEEALRMIEEEVGQGKRGRAATEDGRPPAESSAHFATVA